ncbi:MAG: hypothetical protein MSH65_13390 [Spirochaetia bacterium]|nr:hypothetical protein [Spirochaetia bacterium]
MDKELFAKFIQSISISTIQPTKIDVECLGAIPVGEQASLQIRWKMMYPKEQAFKIVDNIMQLAPMFEISLSYENQTIYSHKSIFQVLITITEKDKFEELWNNEEVRTYFKDKQILKTLWPIVRQQVLDGLSRLSLPPISLPWIM